MGSLRIKLDCTVGGPLSTEEAEKASEEWSEAVTQALADKGTEILGSWPMDKSGRSKGNFRANLQERRKSETLVTIPGMRIEGVTWGPWLEGTSERNSSTKFRGYHLFRKTRQQLQKMAPGVAQEQLEKLMPGIGGE